MHRLAAALAFLLAAPACVAQAGAGASSAECRQALDAMHAQEDKAAAARAERPGAAAGIPKALDAARRAAARACLGGSGEPAPPTRSFTPPVGAFPPPAARTVPPAPTRPAVPPVAAPRRLPPPVVTNCDDAGCWTSDGRRLQRLGPTLIGPRGACTVQGGMLNCP